MFERIITPPAVEPVTVPELALFAHQDVPEEMAGSPPSTTTEWLEKEVFISAARAYIEQIAMIAMVNQRWLLAYDCFPDVDRRQYFQYDPIYSLPPFWYLHPAKHSVELLRRPVNEAGSPPESVVVTYYDLSGTLQTFDSSNYTVFGDKITLLPGKFWPNAARMDNAVRIEYSAGYGDTADAVDARLKQAVKFVANHYWDNRAVVAIEPTSEVYMTLTHLLYGFKLYRVAR
ncbi:MAG TPA: hypothetical protein VFA89_20970 [Terriglobales bacterium]|nr:hypothetical protein [Terriglobales bacterium]